MKKSSEDPGKNILVYRILLPVFVLFFEFFSLSVSAQLSTDSLKVQLKLAKDDTTRCNILNILIDQEQNDDVWAVYNNEVTSISEQNLKSLKNNPPLIHYFTKCLAGAYNNTGYLAKFKGDIPGALENYHKSLRMFEQINDRENVANILNNIGFIYKDQGDFEKALSTFSKNLELYKQMNNKYGIAMTFNNLGIINSDQGKLEEALYYYEKSLAQTDSDHKRLKAYVFNNLGDVYEQQSKLKDKTPEEQRNLKEKALLYFKNGLEIQEAAGDKRGVALSLTNISLVLFDLGEINEGKEFAEKGLNISKQIGYPDNIKRASESLSQICAKQNNWKEAYEMHVLFKRMNDSMNNEVNKKMAIRKGFQYEYDKKTTADSVRSFQERKVFSAQLQQERTQRMALYCGIILVGVFGAFMFNRFKVTKKQNQLIVQQKSELQMQKELVEAHQKETLDSIHYAKRIQSALIANSDFITGNIGNNFIFFKPKDIVSGDFYWATIHKEKFYLAVCDSTGHGVPGAFMSLLNMGFLSEAIKEKNIEKPNEVFNYVRERLITSISDGGQRDGMDGVLISIDKKTNVIEYAAANNEPVLVRNKQIIELPKDKMPVGSGEDLNSFALYSFIPEPGDSLYLYTDGYADQFGGPKGKKYKYKQLNELLVKNSGLEPQQQKQLIETEFENWKGNLEQVDDVCIVGLSL